MNKKELKIIKSKRRTLALHISSSGELIVKAPISLNEKYIWSFIESKKEWITKKQEIIKKRIQVSSKNTICYGGQAPFLGDFYSITVDQNIKLPVIFDNKFIFKSDQDMHNFLLIWYKTEAHNILPGIIECEAAKHNFKFKSIKINSAKKRWGSCNSQGGINLSWRLVTLPEEVINYIVVHELAHLKEMNHSKKFWNVVENMMSNYKVYEKWLKNNYYKYSINC